MLDEDVELAGVNGMTMNFGETHKPDLSMGKNAIRALKKLHAQLKKIYQDKKIFLSDKAVWAKIGATPMIGQNDLSNEIFTLADAKTLNQFAQKVAWVVCPYGPLDDRASTTSSVHTMSYPIFIVVL
ncbi:putative bifunctional chitinase/lysozyme [Lactococcus lactis]|nr:putative bifunctional chitinase/lysozyme [Lactococcus lactis]